MLKRFLLAQGIEKYDYVSNIKSIKLRRKVYLMRRNDMDLNIDRNIE